MPAVLDVPAVVLAGQAAFPLIPGGTSFEDRSFAGILANCALTDRLCAGMLWRGAQTSSEHYP
jgi:hypothetical protein